MVKTKPIIEPGRTIEGSGRIVQGKYDPSDSSRYIGCTFILREGYEYSIEPRGILRAGEEFSRLDGLKVRFIGGIPFNSRSSEVVESAKAALCSSDSGREIDLYQSVLRHLEPIKVKHHLVVIFEQMYSRMPYFPRLFTPQVLKIKRARI